MQEAILLLATLAEDLATAMRRIRRLAYAILDGTLIPIDRVTDQKPYYSGKHKRHGVNVQFIADAAGRLVWASPALPGPTHDLTAARIHSITDTLTNADVMTFAGQGYQGARGSVRTPFKRRRFRPKLSRRQKTINQAHARIHARGKCQRRLNFGSGAYFVIDLGGGSRGGEDAFAEEVEVRPAIHLSLDRLDAVDLALDRA
ncbi:hypothetical protein BFV98_10700 [Micromonospora sp. WMMB235]|nr:hypothetical protein BFV98_10700 [Micromonospora sp. WMMB235]